MEQDLVVVDPRSGELVSEETAVSQPAATPAPIASQNVTTTAPSVSDKPDHDKATPKEVKDEKRPAEPEPECLTLEQKIILGLGLLLMVFLGGAVFGMHIESHAGCKTAPLPVDSQCAHGGVLVMCGLSKSTVVCNGPPQRKNDLEDLLEFQRQAAEWRGSATRRRRLHGPAENSVDIDVHQQIMDALEANIQDNALVKERLVEHKRLMEASRTMLTKMDALVKGMQPSGPVPACKFQDIPILGLMICGAIDVAKRWSPF